MGEGGEGGGGHGAFVRDLDQTPSWAVAAVCGVIVIISILLEKGLHHIGEWFEERRKKAMREALEKVKAELMILGFISLLLTFGQNYITQICITEQAADTMLPCLLKPETLAAESGGHGDPGGQGDHGSHGEQEEGGETHHRRLLSYVIKNISSGRRILSGGEGGTSCPIGKVSLISADGLHQLHIFIFFLAVFHVLYSALTMALGRAKIRLWKEWERDTTSLDYEFSNDPRRFRLAHETSFVRQHESFWNKIPVSFYCVSFFRQFYRSVRKADYLSMRHGFISVHLAPGSKFDFQKYIKRSMEDDFKVIVGISTPLWTSAVLFLLLNVNGWQTLLWISIMPLIMILAVGTKLQAIITEMALEIKERHSVVQGIPVVHVSDHHFWFGRPEMVLFLIHFTLFQNAFQLIYLFWMWYEFGWMSCFHQSPKLIVARVCLGVGVQFLCSYITLPLYALVSQMGSSLKRSIFDEQTSKALKKWLKAAKNNLKANSPSGSPSSASPKHARTMGSTKRRNAAEQETSAAEADAEVSSSATTTTSEVAAAPVNHGDILTGTTYQQTLSAGQESGGVDNFYPVKL